MANSSPHSEETRKTALDRVYRGETINSVADEMGIGRETLRRWHVQATRVPQQPYPGDQAIAEMTDKLLRILWSEVVKLEHRANAKNSKPIDARKVKDVFDAIKAGEQLQRQHSSKPKPVSPLAALTQDKAA